MNAIVSLCHFCELHGPSVLFCTQAFHPDEPSSLLDHTLEDVASSVGAASSRRGKMERSISGNSNSGTVPDAPASAPVSPTGNKTPDFCEACRSASMGHNGFISNDPMSGIRYISSHQARYQKVFSMVRQACLRSLSCEVCPGKEGPIFFGDDHSGHVFSYTFSIKDSQARGFQRSYSIIVIMMDKIYLLNSFPFLVSTVRRIIENIQKKAEVVYDEERALNPVPRARLSSNPSNLSYRQMRGPVKSARSIQELTNDREIYRWIHQSFTWILKAGGNRLKEILLEGPPTEDSVIDLEKQEEMEEDGYVMVDEQKPSTGSEMDALTDSGDIIQEEAVVDNNDINTPLFSTIRSFLDVVGDEKFHLVAHHVIIGNQVIIKSDHKKLILSLIEVLKVLLPKGCCKVIAWSTDYVDSWRCNFLGLKPSTEIPSHVGLYVCIDIMSPEDDNITLDGNDEFTGFTFDIQSPRQLPEQAPAVLEKMENVLFNKELKDSVVDLSLISLKEEWMNKVKLRFMLTKAGGQSSDSELWKLLPVIGAGKEDLPVLRFWMTGLSVQYKHHMLNSAKARK